jgi:hypothetical protein
LQSAWFCAFYSAAAGVNIKILSLLLFLAAASPAVAEAAPKNTAPAAKPTRFALVIGNDHYEPAVGPLRNTGNDARAMAKALRALGFSVMEKHNVSRDELMTALLQFRAKLTGADVALFYFAGHGLSLAGVNYLVPLKSGYRPEDADDTGRRLLAETKLFNAEQAVVEMSQAGTGCNLVILDACRSTPVAREPGAREVTIGGLVDMNPPAGSLVAFATDAGHTAEDGAGTNGLYTGELIKSLLTPGLSIEQIFKRTRAAVMARSGGKQIPAEYSRLVGDDIFLRPNAGAPATPPPALTIADISSFASAGDAARCVQALREFTARRGFDPHADTPLAILLEQVKEDLRDPAFAKSRSESELKTCDLVLEGIRDGLAPGHPQRATLTARACNRRGDALLLLDRAEDALMAYNDAIAATPEDGYVLYNRGRAFLALGRLDEAKADFSTAAGEKYRHSAVRKLAEAALAAMK